jgi:hypothetical protein
MVGGRDDLAIGQPSGQNCSERAPSPQRELDEAFPLSTGGASNVSTTTAISEATEPPHDSPRPPVPFKSPTYPQRVHFAERAELEQRLRSIEERIQAVRRKLDLLGNQPERATLERLYFQMLGARDQVAEEVRRLPLETGVLYDEDKERYEEALAAFERVYRRWEAGGR